MLKWPSKLYICAGFIIAQYKRPVRTEAPEVSLTKRVLQNKTYFNQLLVDDLRFYIEQI